MWALRNQVKDLKEARERQVKLLEKKDAEILKLKRMLKDANQRNLDQEDTMTQMQVFLSEKTAEYGHLMTLKTSKITNLENLVGVYEKRLARMAERLTNLAAERNGLYASLKDAHRAIDFLERKEEDLRMISEIDLRSGDE